jgi:hypothetical protein
MFVGISQPETSEHEMMIRGQIQAIDLIAVLTESHFDSRNKHHKPESLPLAHAILLLHNTPIKSPSKDVSILGNPSVRLCQTQHAPVTQKAKL